MKAILRPLGSDRTGSIITEFAILSPLLFLMMFGVLTAGVQLQSYNALRSVAYDVNRHTMIEYQKGNKLSAVQIEQVAAAIAGRPSYGLATDRFDIVASEEATPVTSAKRFLVSLTYTPPNLIGFSALQPPTLSFDQSIIVPS